MHHLAQTCGLGSEAGSIGRAEVPKRHHPVSGCHGNLDCPVSSTSQRITLHKPTPLVVIAGPVHNGKATLIRSIYNNFQKDPYADFIFAGSLTLAEFEALCLDFFLNFTERHIRNIRHRCGIIDACPFSVDRFFASLGDSCIIISYAQNLIAKRINHYKCIITVF